MTLGPRGRRHGISKNLLVLPAILASDHRVVVVGSVGDSAQQFSSMPNSSFRAAGISTDFLNLTSEIFCRFTTNSLIFKGSEEHHEIRLILLQVCNNIIEFLRF